MWRGNAWQSIPPPPLIRLTPAPSSKQAQRNRTGTCIDYQNHGIIPLTGLTRSVAVQLTPTTTRYTHRVSINFHRFTDRNQPFPLSRKMLPVAWRKSGKRSSRNIVGLVIAACPFCFEKMRIRENRGIR